MIVNVAKLQYPQSALWWRNKHVVKFDFFSTICFLFVLIKAEPVIFQETFILVSFFSLWQFKSAIHDAITSPKIVFTSWVLRSLEMWLNIFMLRDNFFLNVFGCLFCCLFVLLFVCLVVCLFVCFFGSFHVVACNVIPSVLALFFGVLSFHVFSVDESCEFKSFDVLLSPIF